LQQCEELLEFFKLCPTVFKNKSGGLLEAMRQYHDTWYVSAISAKLKEQIEAVNGKHGFYEDIYTEYQCPQHL
jgi:hypothetical protein